MLSTPTITGTGNINRFTVPLVILILLGSCGQSTEENTNETEAVPKVKFTTVSRRDMETFEKIPATVIYFDKSDLTAPVTGFLTKVKVQTGDLVQAGQLLFELETKEHRAINKDSSLRNDNIANYGLFSVKAPTRGYITNALHQKDDFVQEGSGLCSFVRSDHVLIEAYVPMRLRPSLPEHPYVDLLLPDQQQIKASMMKNMNQVDPASQMLRVLFKPYDRELLPEGLNLQVLIPIAHDKNAQVLPKEAVLSNERLSEFWVMVLQNDTTAIKIPVTPGITQSDSMAIINPIFSPGVRILTEGSYGLPDTARVALMQ